jgi:hypothetical protein
MEDQKGTRIRLWIDELPDSVIENVQFIESKCCTHSKRNWNATKLGVEVCLQKHNSNYGLLGLEVFPPDEQNILSIKVYYTNSDEKLFSDTLAHSKKTVFSALPREYAVAIAERVKNFLQQIPDLPSGTLAITVGAHCEIGSSKALFGIIAEILLNILMINGEKGDILKIQEIADNLLASVFI